MAKNKMQIKYKNKKRERNKYNPTVDTKDQTMSFIKTFVGVFVFLGLMYLIILGLEKIGLFQIGYTAPAKESTTINYEFIPIGTVFNRSEKEYYVLFDNYKNNISSDPFINELVKKSKIRVYKVDMSLKESARYNSIEPNKKATRASELKINDITLIKITNGRISEYIVSRTDIEEYLTK